MNVMKACGILLLVITATLVLIVVWTVNTGASEKEFIIALSTIPILEIVVGGTIVYKKYKN